MYIRFHRRLQTRVDEVVHRFSLDVGRSRGAACCVRLQRLANSWPTTAADLVLVPAEPQKISTTPLIFLNNGRHTHSRVAKSLNRGFRGPATILGPLCIFSRDQWSPKFSQFHSPRSQRCSSSPLKATTIVRRIRSSRPRRPYRDRCVITATSLTQDERGIKPGAS